MREVVTPRVETASKLLEKNAALIYWLTANAASLGTAGTLTIYDGYDNEGKAVFQMISGYDRFNTFVPPIKCNQGVYVEVDAAIGSYVVAYNGVSAEEKETK